MPRQGRHPLTIAVRRALPRPPPAGAADYIRNLDRRLEVLAGVARGKAGGLGRLRRELPARVNARRFPRGLEGTWDDGDENLVRGYLDRWVPHGEDPVRAAARSLTEAALALGRMQARPEALWFFLWEMESLVSEMVERVADKPGASLLESHPTRKRAPRGGP